MSNAAGPSRQGGRQEALPHLARLRAGNMAPAVVQDGSSQSDAAMLDAIDDLMPTRSTSTCSVLDSAVPPSSVRPARSDAVGAPGLPGLRHLDELLTPQEDVRRRLAYDGKVIGEIESDTRGGASVLAQLVRVRHRSWQLSQCAIFERRSPSGVWFRLDFDCFDKASRAELVVRRHLARIQEDEGRIIVRLKPLHTAESIQRMVHTQMFLPSLVLFIRWNNVLSRRAVADVLRHMIGAPRIMPSPGPVALKDVREAGTHIIQSR